MLPRFLVRNAIIGKTVTLDAENSRHARAVRIKEGDDIHLFDGEGNEYEAVVRAIGKHFTVEVLSAAGTRKPSRILIIAFSTPKGDRADWLVEKATELGASVLIPLTTQRTVVVPSPAKIERWRRVAADAARQCGRATVPDITQPTLLDDVLSEEADVKIVLDPDGKPLLDIAGKNGSVLCIIGPEGGLTDEETSRCVENGCALASLGPLVLRIETAAIATCAMLLSK